MARPLQQLAARMATLSPQDEALAGALAAYLAIDCADLGDEREVAASLLRTANEDLPRARVSDALFNAALEQARAIRQGRLA